MWMKLSLIINNVACNSHSYWLFPHFGIVQTQTCDILSFYVIKHVVVHNCGVKWIKYCLLFIFQFTDSTCDFKKVKESALVRWDWTCRCGKKRKVVGNGRKVGGDKHRVIWDKNLLDTPNDLKLGRKFKLFTTELVVWKKSVNFQGVGHFFFQALKIHSF